MNTGIHIATDLQLVYTLFAASVLNKMELFTKTWFFLGRSTEANIANQSYNLIFNARIETPTKVWKVGTSTYIQTVLNYSFN